MKATLRLLLAVLGASAVLIALSILFTGAEATARFGERSFEALAGPSPAPSAEWAPTMDSELRFYAALWGAYGLLLLLTARDYEGRASWVPWLATVFFAGGVGRVLSWVSVGAPHPFFLMLMATELIVPPVLIALWFGARRRRA
jgi:hypothetical protein